MAVEGEDGNVAKRGQPRDGRGRIREVDRLQRVDGAPVVDDGRRTQAEVIFHTVRLQRRALVKQQLRPRLRGEKAIIVVAATAAVFSLGCCWYDHLGIRLLVSLLLAELDGLQRHVKGPFVALESALRHVRDHEGRRNNGDGRRVQGRKQRLPPQLLLAAGEDAADRDGDALDVLGQAMAADEGQEPVLVAQLVPAEAEQVLAGELSKLTAHARDALEVGRSGRRYGVAGEVSQCALVCGRRRACADEGEDEIEDLDGEAVDVGHRLLRCSDPRSQPVSLAASLGLYIRPYGVSIRWLLTS